MTIKKKYDDTDLAWYGLIEEDIEKIIQKGDFVDGDIVIDALKLSTMFNQVWYFIDLEDIIALLKKNKRNEKLTVKEAIRGLLKWKKVYI